MCLYFYLFNVGGRRYVCLEFLWYHYKSFSPYAYFFLLSSFLSVLFVYHILEFIYFKLYISYPFWSDSTDSYTLPV